jgi:uncharacterized protein (TIGR02147 family)
MDDLPKPGSVYAYLDYQAFLKDRYKIRKGENRAFSHRYIASKAGMTSAQLTRVMNGKRNLNPLFAKPLAKVFGLKEDEREFFETLVLFCVAKTHAEKSHFLEKIIRIRTTAVKTLEKDQYEYFSAWYYTGLRELLNFYPFDGDYAKLARKLRPPIKTQDAKKAMDFLLQRGLVELGSDGVYRLADKLISSGRHIPAALMNNLHMGMGVLALRAVAEVDPLERNFSALTLSLSPNSLDTILAKLRRFRKEILEVARQDPEVDRVYQMNFQVFPLSNPEVAP